MAVRWKFSLIWRQAQRKRICQSREVTGVISVSFVKQSNGSRVFGRDNWTRCQYNSGSFGFFVWTLLACLSASIGLKEPTYSLSQICAWNFKTSNESLIPKRWYWLTLIFVNLLGLDIQVYSQSQPCNLYTGIVLKRNCGHFYAIVHP